jgi:type IV pilus assembly protein PilB
LDVNTFHQLRIGAQASPLDSRKRDPGYAGTGIPLALIAADPKPMDQSLAPRLSPDPTAPRTPRALAEAYAVPYIDLRRTRIENAATEAIPLGVLSRVRAAPYALEEGVLHIAVSDPSDLQTIDDLRLASPFPIKFAVATPADIDFELQRLLRGHEVHERAEFLDDLPTEEEELEIDESVSDAPPIRLVNSIMLQAAEEGASDVHFLPQSDGLVARMRVDGVLNDVERIPKRHAPGIVSRIKVLAKLDIAERRIPQDGRFTLRLKTGRVVDIRVAVLPTVQGEGVIMRLLDKSREAPTLTEVGLSKEMQMVLEDIVHRPTGCFLVTGPTGSGKTTTLYAALADVVRPEINVISVEDPVEYLVDDVYQVQVNSRHGVTFASALRSILRSDPDVVMVGEIRDLETAKIALEAALTGHTVFSTLHTNDAPSALTRLTDLGIEPYMLGSAITAVLAQRLVRRLCEQCREPYEPSPADLEQLGLEQDALETGATFYRRRSCANCLKGYRGRTGVFQLMVMNDELRRLAALRAGSEELTRAACAAGMTTLWQDGIAKVAAGLTTVEELTRVVR